MKKLLFALIVVALLVPMTGTAIAGGWWIEYGTPNDPLGEPNLREEAPSAFPQLSSSPWGNPNTTDTETPCLPDGTGGPETCSPHGGFLDSTNMCKTCHAVHNANDSSFRLLHDTDRMVECDFCHGAATGRSSHRPYGELFIAGETVRGEHTLGTDPLASDQGLCIPNSTKDPDGYGNTAACPDDAVNGDRNGRLPDRGVGDRDLAGNGLYCFDCHSVHGANTITTVDDGVPGGWDVMILRVDPAGDGGNIETDGVDPGPNNSFTDNALRSAFCQDCHDLAKGWDNDPTDDATVGATRPNPSSHVQGPAGDWFMEVYGTNQQVAWTDILNNPDYDVRRGCVGCHSSDTFEDWRGVDKSDPTDDPTEGVPGDFPHQGTGHKLLDDAYQDAQPVAWGTGPYEATTFGEVVGDPRRPLDAMDRICGDCHTNTFSLNTATQGVGITY